MNREARDEVPPKDFICECGEVFLRQDQLYEHGDKRCLLIIRRDIHDLIELRVTVEVERASRIQMNGNDQN